MSTVAGCSACDQMAYGGGHEPYLVDERIRLWRCTACATLWHESERSRAPVTEEQADALRPSWRDRERWIRSTPVPVLLSEYRRGDVDPSGLRTALLHHDVLVARTPAPDDGTVVLYSRRDVAAADGQVPDGLRVRALARAVRGGAVDRLVVDPRTPWALDMSGEMLQQLVWDARAVCTWSSRVRGEELRFSFPASVAERSVAGNGRATADVPLGLPLPVPPQGDPYAGRAVVDEVLSAAVVAYLSYGSAPFPCADEDAVAAVQPGPGAAELAARVRSIDAEMTGFEVDWTRHGFPGGCAEAAATLRARHPELGPEALAALDWAFSYRWR